MKDFNPEAKQLLPTSSRPVISPQHGSCLLISKIVLALVPSRWKQKVLQKNLRKVFICGDDHSETVFPIITGCLA